MQYALLIYSSPDVLSRHGESTRAEYEAITASPGVLSSCSSGTRRASIMLIRPRAFIIQAMSPK